MPRSTGFCCKPDPRIWMRGWSLPPKKFCTITPGVDARASETFRFALPVRSSAATMPVPPGMASSFPSATSSSSSRRPWTTISSVTTIAPGAVDWAKTALNDAVANPIVTRPTAQERLGVVCKVGLRASQPFTATMAVAARWSA